MTIFIIEHAPSGDILRTYGGVDEETVKALASVSGNPYDIVDEATYNAALPVKAILEPK
jgi:hypothetical protein